MHRGALNSEMGGSDLGNGNTENSRRPGDRKDARDGVQASIHRPNELPVSDGSSPCSPHELRPYIEVPDLKGYGTAITKEVVQFNVYLHLKLQNIVFASNRPLPKSENFRSYASHRYNTCTNLNQSSWTWRHILHHSIYVS